MRKRILAMVVIMLIATMSGCVDIPEEVTPTPISTPIPTATPTPKPELFEPDYPVTAEFNLMDTAALNDVKSLLEDDLLKDFRYPVDITFSKALLETTLYEDKTIIITSDITVRVICDTLNIDETNAGRETEVSEWKIIENTESKISYIDIGDDDSDIVTLLQGGRATLYSEGRYDEDLETYVDAMTIGGTWN